VKRQSRKILQNDTPQTWIGVNFWSRSGATRMWRDYDAPLVGEELEVMRDHGMTVTRSFFYWPDFMPTPDTIDEKMAANFADFLDQHHRLGMQSIPTFLVGHMSGQNWDPSWRNGRDIFSDVWFVARQAWYVRELTARFAKHPAVAAWLLTNEIPIYGDWRTGGVGVNDHDVIASWAQILIDAVRAGGGTQPVSVGDGAWGVETTGRENGFRVRELAKLTDFIGPHVYRMETDPVRQNLGAAFICELLDIGGLPVIMEEFGVTSDYVSEENAAHYYRQALHNTLLAGATGWLTWNNTDYDDHFDTEPYLHHPFEMHFGVTDRNGRPKAQALEVQKFAELGEQLRFAELSRPDAEAVLVVSSYLEAQYPFTEPTDATNVFDVTRQAYVACREADIPIGVARELDALPNDEKLYIVPSTKQLTGPTWRRLVALAEAGATVYASWFVGDHAVQRGTWWPDLDEMFGVRKLTRYGLADTVESNTLDITFRRAFGGIAAGEVLTVQVAGNENSRSFLPVEVVDAEVLAVDQLGRPVLTSRPIGTGRMVLCTYPIEYFAAHTASVNPEPTWRIYDALASESGIRRSVLTNDPRVLAAELVRDDGSVFTWFVNQDENEVTIEPTLDRGRLTTLDDDRLERITVPAYGVVVSQHVGDD
jgi:endo-1,4-beta-mannosidase